MHELKALLKTGPHTGLEISIKYRGARRRPIACDFLPAFLAPKAVGSVSKLCLKAMAAALSHVLAIVGRVAIPVRAASRRSGEIIFIGHILVSESVYTYSRSEINIY